MIGGRASITENPNQHDWDEMNQRCRKCGLSPLNVIDVNWCSVGQQKRDDSPQVEPPPEPVRRYYSREEIIAEARDYMVRMFGQPNEAADKDAWHARFGLLVDFLSERFPAQEGRRV